MFFILSTGRSGSQTIASFISNSTKCVCLHEPEPRLIKEATQFIYGNFSEESLVNLLRSTRCSIKDGLPYGESNHKLSLVISALHKSFPEAKYVWITRDGRNAVASMYARGWYGMKNYDPGFLIWEKWRIKGDDLGVMSHSRWTRFDSFEKCCWYWSFKNRLIGTEFQKNYCNFVHIRLEELQERAEELFHFLGLSRIAKIEVPKLNEAKPKHHPLYWRSWTSKQIKSFVYLCGKDMDELYPGWAEGASSDWRKSYEHDPRSQIDRLFIHFFNRTIGYFQRQRYFAQANS